MSGINLVGWNRYHVSHIHLVERGEECDAFFELELKFFDRDKNFI